MLNPATIENLFKPSTTLAQNFINSIKLDLCKSYEYIFSLVSELFDSKEQNQFNNAVKIIKQSDKKLSGYAHSIHDYLVFNVEAKNVDSVKKYINQFITSNLLVNELDTFNFSSESLGYDKFYTFKSIVNIDDNYKIELAESDQENYNRSKLSIADAFMVLKNSDNELYNEITTLISEVVLLQNKTNNLVSSGTSFKTYGTIFIASNINDSLAFFIESIVHEAAHLYLFAIALSDNLVLNLDEERFSAPLRKDKRTMTGIYHAVFVIGRILYAFCKIKQHKPESYRSFIGNDTLIRKHISNFRKGVGVIKEYGKLTSVGRNILLNLIDFVEYDAVNHAN